MAGSRLSGWVKFAAAVALAPTAALVFFEAARSFAGLLQRPAHTQFFLVGCAAYPLFHFATAGLGLLVRTRRFIYVFGHEFSHAAAAWLCGHSVKSWSVNADGGHVDVSSSNAFIALAPYFVPIYALLVVLVYRGWLWYGGVQDLALAHELFLAALGAALSFHWLFTLIALWTVRQPDLEAAGGKVFSLVLICLANGAALLVALKCLFPRMVNLEHSAEFAKGATAAFWLGLLRLVPMPR